MGCKFMAMIKHQTKLTTQLESEGISIHFEDEIEKMPDFVFENKKGGLIVYTPAIPKDHKGGALIT